MGKQLDILVLEFEAGESASMGEELRHDGVEFGTLRTTHASNAVAALAELPPDLILIYSPHPTPSTFETLETLREESPKVPVLVITTWCDPGQLVELLEGGAAGHVRHQTSGELASVIGAVLEKPPLLDLPAAEELCIEPLGRETVSRTTRTSCASAGVHRVCERCGRIADDSGNWERINIYLRRCQRATVALGLCPSCAEELATVPKGTAP